MSMYALQVMTGMEAEITRKLRGKGVDARCLQERRMIRRGGKWQEQLYTLFPSYIFVSTPDVYRVYYAVRHEDGVLHWLGATKGTPEALSAHEEANILWLAGDGPLPPSEAEMQADGTLDFTSGPLAHLKELLEKVKSGEANYHFIEIMGCPGGCVNGGGQPQQPGYVRNTTDIRALRAKVLYDSDVANPIRKSHENPAIKELYATYLGEPGSEKAHHLLHTSYVKRTINQH